jgi:8-oxo-dGTP diphosphatase
MLIPPGGGVEFGESLRKALKREFYEETGLHVHVGDFLSLYEFIEPPLHALEFFFLVTAENTQIPHTGTDPELKENQIIESVNFVTFDKLRIMDNEYKHRILHEINDRQGLLNLKGRFKLS